MVFDLPGFTDLTGPYNQAVTIKLGSWAQTSTAGSSASSTVESGKTYKVTTRSGSAGTDGNTFNTNGEKYFYVAFAEHPFVSSKGVPVTAR